jgi:hypothetical protein
MTSADIAKLKKINLADAATVEREHMRHGMDENKENWTAAVSMVLLAVIAMALCTYALTRVLTVAISLGDFFL